MKTRRSRFRLRTKTDSDPRNRYTTAPLVINHANAIDLGEKVFLQANREHKQERDQRNLKLQINMRLLKIIRSSSLYSKGLIATGEQDQELGPGSQQAALAAQLQQNDVCFMRKSRTKQTQTLRRATAAIYRVLGVTPLDAPPNGSKHDTRSNGPKYGVAAP